MTTPDQHKIDQGRQRTLDERLAMRWPGCMPTTTRHPRTGKRITTIERGSKEVRDDIEVFCAGYNAAMEDARRLIEPPIGLETTAKPTLLGESGARVPSRQERQRAARAGLERMFQGKGGACE